MIFCMFYPSKDHIPHIMFCIEFHKCVNASAAVKSIQSAYEDDAVNERNYRRWFFRFLNGDFNLKDEQKESRLKI